MDAPFSPADRDGFEFGTEFRLSAELDAALKEWDTRVKRGEAVVAEDFFPGQPELAAQMRECIRALESLCKISDNPDAAVADAPPEIIGNYRVISELGRGGSSVVYVAEQSSPRRRVALKLFDSIANAPRMESRFRLETQLLASLQHSGIAQIYDAGMTVMDGAQRAYFTMELVDGLAVSHFIRQKVIQGSWSVNDTVSTCLGFCDALSHAHDHGITHRDLKPGNLLVTNDGTTKVIDFGIARLESSAGESDPITVASSVLVGTWPYMSPEQFGGEPGSIDRRTDVYGLAVVLYELLAGRLPYDVQSKSLWETAKTVRTMDPKPLGSSDRRLRGDLAVILETALAKEPSERYASMREFSADLRRYLDGHPIHARRQTAISQLRKWSRRHPVAAIASLVSVIALASLTFVASSSAKIAWTKSNELRHSNERLVAANLKIRREVRKVQQSEWKQERTNLQLLETTERLRRTILNSKLMHVGRLADSQPQYMRALLHDRSVFPADQRGFSWQLAERQTRRQVVRFNADSRGLFDLAIADDGSWLVTTGANGLRVWDLTDNRRLAWMSELLDSPRTRLAIDSDQRRVLFCRADGQVSRLQFDTGERLRLPAQSRGVARSLALLAGSDAYLVGDQDGQLQCWESPGGPLRWSVQLSDAPLIALTPAADSKQLGVLNERGDAFVCRLSDGAVVAQTKLPRGELVRGRFSSDLRFVAGAAKLFRFVGQETKIGRTVLEPSWVLSRHRRGPWVRAE